MRKFSISKAAKFLNNNLLALKNKILLFEYLKSVILSENY